MQDEPVQIQNFPRRPTDPECGMISFPRRLAVSFVRSELLLAIRRQRVQAKQAAEQTQRRLLCQVIDHVATASELDQAAVASVSFIGVEGRWCEITVLLRAMYCKSSGGRCVQVADVQKIAMRHLRKGQQPSLKSVTERWLGKTLDKTHQCSNWDERPLTSTQLSYAAIDAVVLLDLAHKLGISPADAHDMCVDTKQNHSVLAAVPVRTEPQTVFHANLSMGNPWKIHG